jgi:hypothetical protein
MELLLTGVALQGVALALMALLLGNRDSGKALLVRLRADGRHEQAPDPDLLARRQQYLRVLVTVFAGGTVLALAGFVRI